MMGGISEALFTSTDIFLFPDQEAVEKLSEKWASFLELVRWSLGVYPKLSECLCGELEVSGRNRGSLDKG